MSSGGQKVVAPVMDSPEVRSCATRLLKMALLTAYAQLLRRLSAISQSVRLENYAAQILPLIAIGLRAELVPRTLDDCDGANAMALPAGEDDGTPWLESDTPRRSHSTCYPILCGYIWLDSLEH